MFLAVHAVPGEALAQLDHRCRARLAEQLVELHHRFGHGASLAYGLHTGRVQILLGTENGLARLDRDGHLDWIAKGRVRTINGQWAIIDDAVVAIDEPPTGVHVDPAPLCLASTAAGVLVGTAQARLFVIAPGSQVATPVDSFDRIPTRSQWYTPWGGPPDTRSIARTVDGAALVNVHVGGVWRDAGDGRWTEVIDVESDTHHVVAVDNTLVVAAAVGFGESDDNGRSFTFTTAGLHDSYCRAVAVADGHVLVTASDGPFTKTAAVYRRPLESDAPFVKCERGLPEWFEDNIDTFQLAARRSHVVIGTYDGRVFVSNDAGASWDAVADDLGPIHAVRSAEKGNRGARAGPLH